MTTDNLKKEFAPLEEEQWRIIRAARDMKEFSYCPQTNYRVGAAIETDLGIFKGGNIEIRGYSVHAEVSAIYQALLNGADCFYTLGVSTNDYGGYPPCGGCLHLITKITDEIIILTDEKEDIGIFTLDEAYENAYRSGDRRV